MTVREAAERYGVTVPAINQKLKRAGHDVNKLRIKDKKSGFYVFTEEGEQLLESLFAGRQEAEEEDLEKQIREKDQVINDLRKEIESLSNSVASLKHELSEAKIEKERIMKMLETEQDNHRKLLLALPSPEEQTKKKGFFSLFRR